MRLTQQWVAVCIGLLLCASSSTGQIRKFRFENLTIADGLSSFRVHDVAQDKRGFLWIGTLGGLDRFDGYEILSYRHDSRSDSSISAGSIGSVIVDEGGKIWAGASNGVLNRLDPRSGEIVQYKLVSKPILCSTQDDLGRLWFGTTGGGIVRIDDPGIPFDSLMRQEYPGFVHLRHNPNNPSSLSNDTVRAIFQDRSGTIWFGTPRGLDRYKNDHEVVDHHISLPSNSKTGGPTAVRAICQDRSGYFWIASRRGLFQMASSGEIVASYYHSPGDPGSLTNDATTCLWEENDRYLWVGTEKGLNRLDRRTNKFVQIWHDPSDPSSLSNDHIRTIQSDQDGIAWIVTDRGVSTYWERTDQFIHFIHDPDPRTIQFVSAIHEASDGALWLGTAVGLKRISGTSVHHYVNQAETPTSISNGPVYAVLEDTRGDIWVGTHNLDRLKTNHSAFDHFSLWTRGERTALIRAIKEDKDGKIWVGTLGGGIFQVDPQRGVVGRLIMNPEDSTSLPNNFVTCIEEARDGTLLVGTDGGGLCRFDPTKQRFSPCTDQSMLNAKTVFHVVVTRSGEIWIATATGFGKLDLMNRTYQHIPVPDSTAPRPIIRLTEDDGGRLWLSTLQDGIYRFDPHTGNLDHFDESDGLQSNQFFPAGLRRSNGEIILGGEKGYNVFHPDRISGNFFIPPVVLTSFKIFGKDHSPKGVAPEIRNIELAYDQNYFSFEFAALDYSSPKRNQYAYKLDGLENNWVPSEHGRFAGYTSVPPGNYTFRVKASNSDGIWNEQGLSIPITITPPFWQTTWFRSLMILLIIGLLTAAYNYRVHQLLQVERMRLKIADDLHDDIGSMLSTIRLRVDLVKNHIAKSYVKEGEHLSIASQVALQTADALRNLVWFLNPEHDRADDIIARMRDAAGKLLVNIEHTFEADNQALLPIMDMEFRRNLLLLYQESLNNIVKHSKATHVSIAVSVRENTFQLGISDDGVGFDPEKSKTGHGLSTLRHRAEQMNGVVSLNSSPGKGTTTSFTAPLPSPPLVVRLKSTMLKQLHPITHFIKKTFAFRRPHDANIT